ncbi:sensor histidine kinase [Methylobacterium sp. NEAU K]|uniref:sensor histidine kinase n=1 Tax=Methylobacterium sp. NEAU K TaxID=3064946 RepID=UPI0027353959|nr:HWE histidine kinase domain-containing protein [Methylobacterium sp. NEAU K]MDP4002917.1 HWE histidine kinase domain-containing protein [Methylobacterium sp. NEAU K]
MSPEHEAEGASLPAVIPVRRSWLSRRLHRFGSNGFSTQVYLVALVIALIGPGLLFTSILLMRYASAERARFEQDARENVRGIGLSLDRDTAGLVSVLQTLATSPRIRQGDFEAFDAQARLVRESIDLDVLLRRPNGQEVVNTGAPRGAPMPVMPLPFDPDLAKGTQRAMVSGYIPGPTPSEATYSVGVPVMVDGEVGYILSFTVPLSRLQGILSREVVPGWTTGISDRSGIVLARLPDPDAVVGRPRLASLRQVQSATPGVWEGQDRQHKPVAVIEARSRLTGWMVATSIPQAIVDARVRRWIWAFAGFGLLVLATSSVLAVNLWSRVSRPLRLLAASGPALSRGEAIPRVPSPVHEIQRLGAVLSDASLRLRTREAERDRALADTRRGLTALSESEARFRHMADSAPALIWMTDETGAVSFANLHFEHLFGMPAAELTNEGWHRIVHPEDLEDFRATFTEAFEARGQFRTEVRVLDKTGAVRWLRCEGVPRLDDDHNFLGYTGCNIDITDAKFAEEHLLLLIHELNHRVKNTLATVQSIAGQSLRGLEGAEADAARAAFEARLLALARVHDVLTRESWEGAELSAVVADAIRPLESGDGRASRFRVVGPALRLPPRLALSIAMALHELGTNAVKYGALSIEGGCVEISWTVRRESETRLCLCWVERGGPPVKKPTRTGFGSRLIERSLARELAGEVALTYEPTGVICTIDAPVPPPGLLERKSAVAPARIAPLPLAG